MSYLIPMDQLESFYIEPGESGFTIEGNKHGFGVSSAIVTVTSPGGGPRLHRHTTEEVHILLDGRMRYLIGDQRFDAIAPYVVNIPATVPHAFTNVGDAPVQLICYFPSLEIWANMTGLGLNPLLSAGAEAPGS